MKSSYTADYFTHLKNQLRFYNGLNLRTYLYLSPNSIIDKATFLSEGTDFFVVTPNKRTFFFPETENLNFGD